MQKEIGNFVGGELIELCKPVGRNRIRGVDNRVASGRGNDTAKLSVFIVESNCADGTVNRVSSFTAVVACLQRFGQNGKGCVHGASALDSAQSGTPANLTYPRKIVGVDGELVKNARCGSRVCVNTRECHILAGDARQIADLRADKAVGILSQADDVKRKEQKNLFAFYDCTHLCVQVVAHALGGRGEAKAVAVEVGVFGVRGCNDSIGKAEAECVFHIGFSFFVRSEILFSKTIIQNNDLKVNTCVRI